MMMIHDDHDYHEYGNGNDDVGNNPVGFSTVSKSTALAASWAEDKTLS